ncbi:MAG: hypothetical protein ACXVHO_07840, partial [Methanobacterium sp.]
CSGVAGFVLYAQNPQLVPAINIKNTTTSDENYVDPTPKYTNYTKKTTTTVKETPTQTTTQTTTTEPSPKDDKTPVNPGNDTNTKK